MIKMSDLGLRIMFCLAVVCSSHVTEVAGKSITTYADLQRLVLKKMPWSNRSKPVPIKPACDYQQCDKVQNLCNNGGTCVVTSDCSLKCRCPKGFTGFFCGVKVSDLVTTISLELETGIKEKSLLAKILKPSPTTTLKPVTTSQTSTTSQTTTTSQTSTSETSTSEISTSETPTISTTSITPTTSKPEKKTLKPIKKVRKSKGRRIRNT